MGKRIALLNTLIALGLAGLIFAAPAGATCSDSAVHLRGDFGTARFNIELADTNATRSKGLMHRESLARSAGMLFVFPRPKRAVFWMRNTLIPLDMIFIGDDGRVLHVHSNAIPLDETPIDGGPNVRAVLEINGGLANRMGLKPGVEIRHPAMPQDNATWPCS